MIVYFSGETSSARPERVLGGVANLMLAYPLLKRRNGKITTRFLKMHNYRIKKGKK